MRLVYFGAGAFGLPTFQQLVDAHEVALVVTQPDRPAGRRRQLTATPIAQAAQQRGVPVIKATNADDAKIAEQIKSVQAKAWVVIAFGQKLSRAMLQGAFAINLHASLLPKYRGAAPINWAMINGERETGLSVITLAQRMDAGDVLGQVSTTIDPRETAGELHDRLAAMGPELILHVLEQFEEGRLHPVVQDEALATPAPKLAKADGTVRFDQAADRVRQRIHGLTPWPGCAVKLDGRPLRLHRVEAIEHSVGPDEPGRVLSDLTIACQRGGVRLLEVQPPGGRLMSFQEYRNGQPVRVGARCEPA